MADVHELGVVQRRPASLGEHGAEAETLPVLDDDDVGVGARQLQHEPVRIGGDRRVGLRCPVEPAHAHTCVGVPPGPVAVEGGGLAAVEQLDVVALACEDQRRMGRCGRNAAVADEPEELGDDEADGGSAHGESGAAPLDFRAAQASSIAASARPRTNAAPTAAAPGAGGACSVRRVRRRRSGRGCPR